jgi:hypothetical protein
MARATKRRGGMAVASGALGMLANVIDVVVAVAAVIIALDVVLVVLEANPFNDIVELVHDAGTWVVGPFKDVFSLDDHKLEVAINWGIALVVYVTVGRLVAGLLRRPQP